MAYGQGTRPKILSVAITMLATRPNMIRVCIIQTMIRWVLRMYST